jgi:hypothetical protein
LVANFGRSLATLLLALLTSTTALADDVFAERIIATYSALESYCDTVATKDRGLVSELRRCYTRDGRYKRIEQMPAPAYQRRREWGDSLLEYAWNTRAEAGTTHYMVRSARSPADGLPDGLTARALQPFLHSVQNETDVSKLLHKMEVVEDGPDTMILQRQYTNPGSGSSVINRLWVRHSDGLVTQGDESWNGRIIWSASLIEARVNSPLSQADLTETAPFFRRFFHHYNLQTRPVEVVSGLAAIAFAIGLVLSIAWRQPRKWGRVWLYYVQLIGIAIVLLAALAVISVLPGMRGGHPPAIYMLLILAAFAGIAALVIAALLLGMQFVDLMRAAFR